MATSGGGSTPNPPASADSQDRQEKLNIKVFDQTYYKKGKIWILPDFRTPKGNPYKELSSTADPEKGKGQKSSWSQETRGNAKRGRGGQNPPVTTDRNQKGQQKGDDKACYLDPDFVSNPSRQREQEADDSEIRVIERIKEYLEGVAERDDPPVFLLHNQSLSSRINRGPSKGDFKIDKNKGEMDILVLHPALGILSVEVKSTKTTDFQAKQNEKDDYFSPFNKATTQLCRARTSIQEEMENLLEKEAVIPTIALPNLGPEAESDIREEAKRRKSKKQASDVKEGTKSTEQPAGVTSDTGSEKQTATTSAQGASKQKELFEDHPEVLLLCGSTSEEVTKWTKKLQQHREKAGPAFKGSTDEERLHNYKLACIRRLSVAALSPGKSVRDSAALHRRFLLTEEQLRVRDSESDFLHVWGPPGSGKTLLLAERARRWIRDDRRVALVVGEPLYTPLLHQLTRSVCGDKTDVARVSTHRDYDDLLRRLYTNPTAEPVFVIVDEARNVDYSRLQHDVAAGRVGGLWSAGTADVSDEAAWQAVGGTTEQLQLCLRCPPSVMALSNTVGGTLYPPLLPPPVPVTRELGERVEVISHADHDQSQPCARCPTCREGVKSFFSSLGLPGDDVTSSLSLSDCIVLVTGLDTGTEGVASCLTELGLRAVAEDIFPSTPVLLPGQTPASRDEAQYETALSRVVSGTDMEGRPVLHVVDCRHFLGLEREVVVVWHQDRGDEDEDRQGEMYRDVRKYFHSDHWFRAVTRCQGRLLLVVDTPSPALSLLPASSAAQATSSSPSPSPDVEATEKHRSAGTDPTQSATLDDSLLACVRPPASRRAVSTDPTPTSSGTPSASTTAPKRAHEPCTLQ